MLFHFLCPGMCHVQNNSRSAVQPGNPGPQSGYFVIAGSPCDDHEHDSCFCFSLPEYASPVSRIPAIALQNVSFSYPQNRSRQVLAGITLRMEKGEIFGFLGPNGSGKTTLFRILTTAFMPTSGSAQIFGMDLAASAHSIRGIIGVVFQRQSLDKKLTVSENLTYYGHLYGMHGKNLKRQIEEVLRRFNLADRARELVETLSEGLKRRVELAKAFLHRPKVLILDEPTAGLDPIARLEFWKGLETINQSDATTILLTTHLMDDAENCHRLGFLNRGELVAVDSPAALKELIRGEVITIRTHDAESLCTAINERFEVHACIVDCTLRIECQTGHEWIPRLVEAFPGLIDAISFTRPTLEDVFIHVTGNQFDSVNQEE